MKKVQGVRQTAFVWNEESLVVTLVLLQSIHVYYGDLLSPSHTLTPNPKTQYMDTHARVYIPTTTENKTKPHTLTPKTTGQKKKEQNAS